MTKHPEECRSLFFGMYRLGKAPNLVSGVVNNKWLGLKVLCHNLRCSMNVIIASTQSTKTTLVLFCFVFVTYFPRRENLLFSRRLWEEKLLSQRVYLVSGIAPYGYREISSGYIIIVNWNKVKYLSILSMVLMLTFTTWLKPPWAKIIV